MISENEILTFIQQDMMSKKKRDAKIGRDYYEGRHDILDYRMFYYNADGELVEDKTRSNIKIPHPFFTELVDQEVNYMLSDKDRFVLSDIPALQNRLDEYFGDDFRAELAETLTDTVAGGFAYMYAYMNAKGQTVFMNADAAGVVEVRAKETNDDCDYIIYWYIDRITKDNKTIKHIQVWDNAQTYFYVQEESGKLEPDPDEEINPKPHIIYQKDNDDSTYYDSYGFIPFFRLDNNKKRRSGIIPVKSLIDDYDLMACGLSNNLADFDHPLHVVKGFKGDNLDELQRNLKTKKLIGVDENGGVEVHTVDIPYEARLAKMEQDEKGIYHFGMGFNPTMVGDGNITNVVIRSRYTLLDLKCDKLETPLKSFLNRLIQIVLDEINRKDETSYQLSDVKVKFNRQVMTNALDDAQIDLAKAQKNQVIINTLLSLGNTLPTETIIKGICQTLDLDYDDVMDKLPVNPEDDLAAAFNTLSGVDVS